jgi:hypothetical protein
VAKQQPYEPSQSEREAIEAFLASRRGRKPTPALKLGADGGKPTLSLDHPDGKVGSTLLAHSLALPDATATLQVVTQIVNACTKGQQPDPDTVNGALAIVQAIEPRDPLETMLAAQMVAVHMATMTLARRLNHVDTIKQQDSASNAFNKLARTYAAQVEALNRHRGKGQQAIRVEHVTVNGGQAIVGSSVTPRGGGQTLVSEGQAHAPAIPHEPSGALPCAHAQREALPSP